MKPSWPPLCEGHPHRASWQSVSQALKAKGQRDQSEIGKRDVMEHQPGPTGNMGS